MIQPILLHALMALTVLLTACSHDTYTTWSCRDSMGEKFPMVLKKAQMQFQDRQYDYCGSLGPQSYFDLKCPIEIKDSSKVFSPSSGLLISNTTEFQCNAL